MRTCKTITKSLDFFIKFVYMYTCMHVCIYECVPYVYICVFVCACVSHVCMWVACMHTFAYVHHMCTYVCVPHVCTSPQRPEQGNKHPGTGVTGRKFGFWELKSGPLERQKIFLSPESSLKALFLKTSIITFFILASQWTQTQEDIVNLSRHYLVSTWE